jgi:hypothetical protein
VVGVAGRRDAVASDALGRVRTRSEVIAADQRHHVLSGVDETCRLVDAGLSGDVIIQGPGAG